MLLVKEKVSKIELYDTKDRFIGITRVFEFAKSKPKAVVFELLIKCNELPNLKKGDSVTLVFEYMLGTRHRTSVKVESCTKSQFTVKVGEVEELPERRRSFKINTNESAIVYKSKSETEEGIEATILNINLGGVLLKCEEKLSVGSTIYLNTLSGALELSTKVLRKQKDINGVLIGYGCQFIDVSPSEEEIVSKYILQCQVAERERRKTLEDIGLK